MKETMDDQFGRAKELFTFYHGSFFQMHREGEYEEYKKYDVPKHIEVEWNREMIEKYTRELSISDWNAVFCLQAIAKNYHESIILENVVSFASRHIMSADSMVKLLYAESIIEIIKITKKVISKELLYSACKAAVNILEDIISKPLLIDPGHELHVFNLKDKKSLNNRAKKSMDELKNFLS